MRLSAIHANRTSNAPNKNANAQFNLRQSENKINANGYYMYTDISGITVDRSDGQIANNVADLLPTECGNNIQFDNRIFGGDATSLWEFPW